MARELRVIGLEGIPEVRPGDDLAAFLLAAADSAGGLQTGDVLVVTQKIVSKAEGRVVDLNDVTPSPFAAEYAQAWQKDARMVEVVLREARRVVRMDRGLLIVETKHGFVCANAGVDRSNVPGATMVTLLPEDPDASAARLRAALLERTGVEVAVIISDTFGRPWREGTTDVAIGLAGMDPIVSNVGDEDPYGYRLAAAVSCAADELTGAAELVMGKISGVPAALIRGFSYVPRAGSARSLVRAAAFDLFR